MKNLKFAFLGLGVLFLLSVFVLGYYKSGDSTMSLWKMAGHDDVPKYVQSTRVIALLGSLGVLALGALMIQQKRMSRLFAGLTLVASLLVLYSGIGGFPPSAPFIKVAAIGAKILLFGGLASLVLAIVGLIKPERALARS